MDCIKRQKKNILNIFDDNNCTNCKYYLNDELIRFGNHDINIYYLINRCKFNKDNFFIANKKTKLIFKEMIIDSYKKSNNIFLFLDKNDNFSSYYFEFEKLLNNNYNIHIIE